MSSVILAKASVILAFVISGTGVENTLSLTYRHKKKSRGVISGDRGGQGVGPSLPIHLFWKCCIQIPIVTINTLHKTLEINSSNGKETFDVWLTVHRSSMWNKKPTRCHLVLYLFLLYKLLNRRTYQPANTIHI